MLPEYCDVCNSPLFQVVPGETTQKEIVEFVERSAFKESWKTPILRDKWIHAGLYCPNGCTQILAEYGAPTLPELSREESIAITQAYSRTHHAEFLQTHGEKSRLAACVHCGSFHGAIVEGQSPTAFYDEPKYRPLRNHKVTSVRCSDPRIIALERTWWYDQGEAQPECDYFWPGRQFLWKYKEVTGWSEYPPG